MKIHWGKSNKMAFFGLFNYNKPGPGVDKGGTNKTRFFYFFELYFRKFWKLLELNLLFLLCCIPIVTIGPAIAGFTYILRNYADERPTFLMYDFFEAFRKNWKQSTGLFLLDLAVSAVVILSLIFYWKNADEGAWIFLPLGICLLMMVVMFFMRFYAYLMAVTVELKFRHILKNALIFAFLGLRTNVITTFFILLIAFPLVWFFPYTVPVILLIGLSTAGFIAVYNSYPYIIRYIVAPHEKKLREERGEFPESPEEPENIFTDVGTQERPAKGANSGRNKVIK